MVIKNGKIVTPTQILDGYDILIKKGIIQEIGKNLHELGLSRVLRYDSKSIIHF